MKSMLRYIKFFIWFCIDQTYFTEKSFFCLLFRHNLIRRAFEVTNDIAQYRNDVAKYGTFKALEIHKPFYKEYRRTHGEWKGYNK